MNNPGRVNALAEWYPKYSRDAIIVMAEILIAQKLMTETDKVELTRLMDEADKQGQTVTVDTLIQERDAALGEQEALQAHNSKLQAQIVEMGAEPASPKLE